MKNIFLFIRIYFNFLFFLVLQVICIALLVRYSRSHEASYAVIASKLTGSINARYNQIQYYFHLKETNRQLSDENARLRNMLGMNFEGPDSTRQAYTDSLVRDTLGRQRRFIWMPAKVIANTVSQQNNFLTVHRGAAQGVRKGMAAVGPDGIVGVVVDVSDNFSRIMSLLHRNSKVSSMLKKTNEAGSLEWDGKDPRYVTLRNIPKSSQITKGDTVLTSPYSSNFPSRLPVGTVESISGEPSSNFYTIKVRTATNFFSVQYVNLVENIQWAEQRQLEAAPQPNQ